MRIASKFVDNTRAWQAKAIRRIGLICVVVLLFPAVAFAVEGVDAGFADHVAPILAQRCLVCHQGASPQGNLDLTTLRSTLLGGDSGPALTPGRPAQSLLIRRLRRGEMPPDGEEKLTPTEIDRLSQWVEQGAPWPADRQLDRFEYSTWWSLQPVRRPSVPSMGPFHRPATAIDAFIEQTLAARSLVAGAPADRRTLMRRLSFDLIGLPPNPAEVDAFVNDPGDDALPRLVDQLLASPQYGERWGRHWLDLVRYADTAGETADYPVPEAYRYRNYVVQAWNQDTPYDQFLQEQIAGDIIARQSWERGEVNPRRYAELVTATGFLAISRRFGFDNERYEHLMIQDAIDNIGQVLQGQTFGCARCHDHKFDPVSMSDYYALYGILASTRFSFAGSECLQLTRAMTPLVAPDVAARLWQSWSRKILVLREQIRRLKPDYELPTSPTLSRPLTDLDGDFELQAPATGGSLGFPANPWQFHGLVRIERSAQSPYTQVYPLGLNGVKIPEAQTDYGLTRGLVPEISATRTPLEPEQCVQDDAARSRGQRVYLSFDVRNTSNAPQDVGSYRVQVGQRKETGETLPAVEFFISRDQWFVGDHDTVKPLRAAIVNTWYHVEVALDLHSREYTGTVGSNGDWTKFQGRLSSSFSGVINCAQLDSHGHLDGQAPGFEFDNLWISPDEPTVLSESLAQVAIPRGSSDESAGTPATLEQLQSQLTTLLNTPPYPQAYALWEGSPHDVRIQQRGDPEQPGAEVSRRYLRVLGADSVPNASAQSGRKELADWITRTENPLTARVLVNRLWQHHFGHGLVRSENDFGTRGQLPTHPQLLDWLAAELMEGGWSIKALQRQIVLSQAYQRSSDVSRETELTDPENRYLARQSRRRLEAECIRDAILFASEQLDSSMGGPHPFPGHLLRHYTQHRPFRDEYASSHRSIYLMTQRLKRHSFLALFDGSDTNSSTAKRSVSTVPPQALFMMNDAFVHQHATAFAQRLLVSEHDDATRVRTAYERTLGRRPESWEAAESLQFVKQYLQRLGEVRAALAAEDRATEAWAALVRTLFACNEFVYVD